MIVFELKTKLCLTSHKYYSRKPWAQDIGKWLVYSRASQQFIEDIGELKENEIVLDADLLDTMYSLYYAYPVTSKCAVFRLLYIALATIREQSRFCLVLTQVQLLFKSSYYSRAAID